MLPAEASPHLLELCLARPAPLTQHPFVSLIFRKAWKGSSPGGASIPLSAQGLQS